MIGIDIEGSPRRLTKSQREVPGQIVVMLGSTLSVLATYLEVQAKNTIGGGPVMYRKGVEAGCYVHFGARALRKPHFEVVIIPSQPNRGSKSLSIHIISLEALERKISL